MEKLNKKLNFANPKPKGSIKSKNISPNATVSLDAIAGLLEEQEAETNKKIVKKKVSTSKPKTSGTTTKKTSSAKKTVTKKTDSTKNTKKTKKSE